MKPVTFLIATNNAGKLKEMRGILQTVGCGCISLKQAGIAIDIEETGATFAENARIKAQAVYDICKMPVIADDSGLCVDYLNGEPGVRTARYAGDGCDNDANINQLLNNLEGVPLFRRTARFVSAVCAILDGETQWLTFGWCEGIIGPERRGNSGFGYDPVFWLKGNRSFSELPEEKKNAISHRGRAIRKLAFRLRGIQRMR